ncbi:transcriptional regulator, IclR family [Burkholderia sp. D7]|nr:transcriptional regulator, IclR family [Burkholderia sp. D7]
MSILETATAVLRLMALRQSEVTMTDLVEHLSMPKSSASRVLKQMAEEGLLVRNPTTLAYRPSLLLLELAHIVRSSTPLIEMCAQALDTLGTETGHTGYISLLDHNDVVVLRVRPGSQALRAMTNAGRRLPSWATSTGRALLARESDAQIRERFPNGLPVETVSAAPIGGPATVDELIQALDETRRHRYAVAENEALSGVCSVGCAVADPASGECLSFCLTFPSSNLGADDIGHLARRITSHAELIGRSLGDAFWTTMP